jgi:hypothetical protein
MAHQPSQLFENNQRTSNSTRVGRWFLEGHQVFSPIASSQDLCEQLHR